MTDRTVNVRLHLDASSVRTGATQSAAAYRSLADAATASAAQQQRALDQAARTAQTSARAQQSAASAASASLGRLAGTAEEVPAAFASAAAVSERAMGGIATSANAAASSVVGAESRMSEAAAATALGLQGSLAQRLAVAEATVMASGTEQAAVTRTAAAAQSAAAATTTAMTRASVSAEQVGAAFASSSVIADRAMAGMATTATATAAAVAAAETRMTVATAEAAAGIRLSLASRLALGEALVAQEARATAAARAAALEQARIAAEQRAAALAQAGLLSRLGTAAASALASARAASITSASMVSAAERGEDAFRATRTAGLLMLAVFTAASFTAAKFEKSMSNVKAVAVDGSAAVEVQARQFEQLRTSALAAGRDTVYSASQAADAEAELARAGVKVSDIVGGALTGALSLAASGQLDLAEAATISAQAMNTFKLSGKDVGHIADVLSAGANKSAADVHGLGESLRMGGLLAQQTGLSLEDTVGVLSAFADSALIGSDAGTSLKTMLMRLTPQSDEAAGMMQQLGFSAYDAQGRFVGLTELARRLQTSFGALTPEARNSAMSVIFGSDAVRAATILYNQGADGVDRYRAAVDDNGAAARMAAVQLDNLSGDIEALGGSLEVALIQSGTAANSMLREMVQALTDVINGYSALPGWAQTSAVAVLGLGGAVALLGGGLLIAVPRIAEFQTAVTSLSTTMPRLAGAASSVAGVLTNPWVAGIGVVIGALAAFGLASKGAQKNLEEFTQAVRADSGALSENTKTLVAHKLQQAGVLDIARKYGIELSAVTDATLGNKDAVEQVNKALQEHATVQRGVVSSHGELGKSTTVLTGDALKLKETIQGTNGEINDAVAAFKNEQAAAGGAADGTSKLGGAAKVTRDELEDTRSAAEKFTDSLVALSGGAINSAQAAIGYQKSLAELRQAVHENGVQLDITTEKGRAVKSAMLDAAEAALAHAEAVAKQQNSVEAGNIVLGQDVEALKATMKQAGFSQQQIESLTAAYARLPKDVATQVTDPGALQTIADLTEVRNKVEGVPPGKSITIKAPSAEAIQDLKAIGFSVQENTKDKTVKITVPTNDAYDGSTEIQKMINGIRGRKVLVEIGTTGDIRGSAGGRMFAEADGGIMRFAQGGVTRFASGSERHIAQIAPAGSWRVWGEPETGGEGYIPLAASKRARSTDILRQIAGGFGYQLTPTGRDLTPVRHFAGPPAAGPGPGGDGRATTVNLYGASQSFGEQMADVVRHLEFVT